MRPDFSAAIFRGRQSRAFKRHQGYDRTLGHTPPSAPSTQVDAWAGRLHHAAMAAELDEVYRNAKRVLGLKRRDISLHVDDENGGGVETAAFRFDIQAGQDGDHPANTLVERRITLGVDAEKLPPDFDGIFPAGIDEIVVPVGGLADKFEDIADAVEDKAATLNVVVDENPVHGVIELTFPDGAHITLRTKRAEMIIRVPGRRDCLALIQAVRGGMVAQFVDPGPALPKTEEA